MLNDLAAFGAATGAPPFFSTAVGGLCGPRAQGLDLAPGGAPLGGAGYVGGPVPYTPGGVAGNPSGPAPRIYWNLANTQTGDIDKTYASGPSFARYNAWGASITLDFDISDAMSFKSITGARGIDWKVGVDLDGLPETIQEVTDHQAQKQFSQEFQLTGKAFGDKLDYVAGLYYFQEEGFVHDFVPFGSTLYHLRRGERRRHQVVCGVLPRRLQFNDAFGISLGARYSKDDKKFEGGQADLDGYSYKSSGCLDPNGSRHGVLGRVRRRWSGSRRSRIRPIRTATSRRASRARSTTCSRRRWARSSTSMKTRCSTRAFRRASRPAAGPRVSRIRVADIDEAAFGPEKSETYELGLKSQFFDQSRAGQRGGLLHRLHRHPAADPGRRFTGVAERG